eukprot:s8784_g2.t1
MNNSALLRRLAQTRQTRKTKKEKEKKRKEQKQQVKRSSMSTTMNRKRLLGDDVMLEELLQAPEVSPLEAPAEPRAAASKHTTEFEEPVSASKAARFQEDSISRAAAYENMPHNDEVEEDYGDDWMDSDDEEADDEAEEESEESEGEKPDEAFKVPQEFFNEEAGPPEVSPEFLQKLDEAAIGKEIKRLTRMGVTALGCDS